MNDQRISVIIPVYNAERYLATAIQSVLAQTWQPAEILVIDDGSTDGSASIAQQFLPQIQFHQRAHHGAAAARNYALGLTTAPFLAFLDADDLWLPNKLEQQMAAFAEDPELALSFGHVEQFRSPELGGDATPQAMPQIFVGHIPSALLVKRAVFEQIGLFNPTWQIGEFLDWFLQAKNSNLKIKTLHAVIAKRRLHDANLGVRQRHYQFQYAQILKHHLDQQRKGAVDQHL